MYFIIVMLKRSRLYNYNADINDYNFQELIKLNKKYFMSKYVNKIYTEEFIIYIYIYIYNLFYYTIKKKWERMDFCSSFSHNLTDLNTHGIFKIASVHVLILCFSFSPLNFLRKKHFA